MNTERRAETWFARNTFGWKLERERERGKFFRILNVQPAPSRIRTEFLTFTREPSFRVSFARWESWSITMSGVEKLTPRKMMDRRSSSWFDLTSYINIFIHDIGFERVFINRDISSGCFSKKGNYVYTFVVSLFQWNCRYN